MGERLTWEQIEKSILINGWDLLISTGKIEVKSAIVSYIGMSSAELLRMQIKDRNIHATYTTPDNLAPMGTVGYFG